MGNMVYYQIKELLSHKKIIVISLMVSAFLIAGTCFSVSDKNTKHDFKRIKIGVVNEDTSKYSDMMIQFFKNGDSFINLVEVVEGTKQKIKKQFADGNMDAYLIIPQGFAEHMMYIDNLPIEVKINTADRAKAVLLQNIFYSYEKYVQAVEVNAVGLAEIMKAGGASEEFIDRKNREITISLILTALGRNSIFIEKEVELYPEIPLLQYYSFSLLFLLIYYGSLYGGVKLLKEEQNGIVSRLNAAGISVNQMIVSRIFVQSFLLLCTFGVPYLIISVIQNSPVSAKVLLFVFSTAVLCSGFALMLSIIVQKKQKFILIGNMAGLFIMILGGGMIPVMYLPDFFRVSSKCMPNYWFIKCITIIWDERKSLIWLWIMIFFILTTIVEYTISIVFYKMNGVCDE